MSSQNDVRLFVLNNAVLESELRSVESNRVPQFEESSLEREADRLVESYVDQFDLELRTNAERMSEFYRVFYMLENDIRSLIAETMENALGAEWWESVLPAIYENAKKNQSKELAEGVTTRSERMIDYATFGELSEIIVSNWDHFGGIFSNSTQSAVRKIIARLNMIRGPIAHCGMLSEVEVVRLKLTVRDWFQLMD